MLNCVVHEITAVLLKKVLSWLKAFYQPFTVKVQMRYQTSPYGIYGEKSGTEAGFSPNTSAYSSHYHSTSNSCLYFLYLEPNLGKLSNWQLSWITPVSGSRSSLNNNYDTVQEQGRWWQQLIPLIFRYHPRHIRDECFFRRPTQFRPSESKSVKRMWFISVFSLSMETSLLLSFCCLGVDQV